MLDATYNAYPAWLLALIGVRLAVVVLGCVLGLVLLTLRPARDYFRNR